MVSQLIAVCESQKKLELCASIQYRLTAILYKEILSCGQRKADKMVLKELTKTLASLSIDVTDNIKVLSTIDTPFLCDFSAFWYAKWDNSCSNVVFLIERIKRQWKSF